MVKRLGVKHLFHDDLLERHSNWARRLTSAAFLEALESAAKAAANRHGAFQLIRFLRNAFIVPSHFNGSFSCPLCGDPNSEFNLRHIVTCSQFNTSLKAVLPVASAELCERALSAQTGENCHMLIRLRLAFPSLKRHEQYINFDIFSALGTLIHAAVHTLHASRNELLRIVSSKYSRKPSGHDSSIFHKKPLYKPANPKRAPRRRRPPRSTAVFCCLFPSSPPSAPLP